jgi:hypothetical protein
MEKRNKPTYRSTKAVGEIYRSVTVELDLDNTMRPLAQLRVEGMEQYTADALKVKAEYDLAVERLKNQVSVSIRLLIYRFLIEI